MSNNVPVFVGLDYHQDAIQVCVLNRQGDVLLNRAARNDAAELCRLVEPVGRVQRVGIEACCGAADLGEELVDRFGWDVSLGHPAYVARMKGSPDKSDYSDGRLLADLTRASVTCRTCGCRRRRSASCGNWSTTASVASITCGA
jgi:hypothetical protein